MRKKRIAQLVDVRFYPEEDNQENIFRRQQVWLKFCSWKRKLLVFERPKPNIIWTSIQSSSYSDSVLADKLGRHFLSNLSRHFLLAHYHHCSIVPSPNSCELLKVKTLALSIFLFLCQRIIIYLNKYVEFWSFLFF